MNGVRPARPADLERLAVVEEDADRRFTDLFGPAGWPAATSGHERTETPGFVLVAGDPVVGFVHVLDLGGGWHLDQLSVLRVGQGGGVGTALLGAAVAEVGRRGGEEVTLMTYADLPWNAPWYARHGWVEIDPPARLRPLLEGEDRDGLARHGRRIAMVRSVLRR